MPNPPPRLRNALLVGLGVIAGVVGALVVQLFSVSTPLERVAAVARDVPPPGEDAFLDLVALHTGARFEGGHAVDLLLDGDGLFPPLWAEIRAARRSVTVQLYYCKPGRLADSLAAALERPARAGLPVLFLYDAFGCGSLEPAYLERLRDAGVLVHPFRPLRWWSLHRAQERSHARIVVVDGRVAYTGGFGIDDRWSAAGADGGAGWRDTNVRFTGPGVRDLQAAFADGWAEAAGELLVGDTFFPPPPHDPASGDARPAEGVVAGVLHSRPDGGSTTAERLLALTIAAAKRTLYISNAYFLPDDDFRALLTDAARRGVDVRVLTPGEETDVPVVWYAARAHYAPLLEAGVRLYEYQPTMMHAKTFVVDGVWSSIGSMNFDTRSLAANDESTLLVLDRGFGARMDSLFLADLPHAREVELSTFAERGLVQRVRERLAVLSSRAL